jgi:hypothetical protein
VNDDSALRVRVKALALYPAPGGRIIFPAASGTSKDVDVEDLNLDSPRLSPGLEIDVSTKRWRILANYTSFEESDRAALSPTSRRIGDVNVTQGDAIVSSLSVDWGQLQVDRVVLDRAVGSSSRVEVLLGAGVRLYDMSMSMDRIAGGRAQAAPTFVEPLASSELRFTYRQAYTFRLAADAAYSDWSGKATQSWGVMIEAGADLGSGASAQFGYRILTFDLDEGDGSAAFEYRGSLAGLYGGVSFSF